MGNRSFFNALHDREGDFLLATVLEGPAQGERVLLWNTAPVWPEELPAFWGEHLPALAAVTSSGILKSAGQRIFVERFGAAPQLVICGGGHVGASVVRLAKLLGLPVTALEDRPEFAEEQRQAGADAVLCLPFAEGLAQIPGGQETYFVVVTRAHSCDIACLRSILQKPAAYVGMMGSRKRAALVHTHNWPSWGCRKSALMPCTRPLVFLLAQKPRRKSHFLFLRRSSPLKTAASRPRAFPRHCWPRWNSRPLRRCWRPS